jgi:hypothetical protein
MAQCHSRDSPPQCDSRRNTASDDAKDRVFGRGKDAIA